MFSRNERLLLAGLTVVVACSWGRFLDTASLKVDESYPSRGVGLALLVGLVVGWALAVAGWRGLLATPPAHPRKAAFFALGIGACMLPMLSNDVFSVLSYGAVAAEGRDVYTTTQWLAYSPFHPFLGARWADTPSVYGPATLIASLPAGLAGHSAWLGLALLRVVWLAPLVLVMELSLRRLADRPSFHAMVWLNPLWIVEGPGQLHADLLGLVAVVAGMLLHHAGKVRTSFVSYAVALLGKYSFAIAGLWFWLTASRTSGVRRRRLAALTAIVLVTAVALYAPFWNGVRTITVPLRTLGHMNPGGSITEVVGIIVQFLRGRPATPPDLALSAALAADRAAKEGIWLAVSWVMRLVFLAVVVRVLPPMLRPASSDATIALGTGIITTALLTLASHRFQCWYLLAPLPFFGLACPAAWQKWWIAVVAVSVPVDFSCVLDRALPVYPVWGALTTGALVIVFVAWFKRRYVHLEDPADARPETKAPAAR